MSAAETEVRLARLRTALAELPPVHRDVYLLSARDGLAYGEIAIRLGLSVFDVQLHLAEVLARLAERLEPPPDS